MRPPSGPNARAAARAARSGPRALVRITAYRPGLFLLARAPGRDCTGAWGRRPDVIVEWTAEQGKPERSCYGAWMMKLGYRPALDGLRGISILAVMAYHSGLLVGGWAGVDVFFTLSGFLITTLLLEEHAAAGRFSFTKFYARR